MLVTGGIVYIGTRAFAEIHVAGEGAGDHRPAGPPDHAHRACWSRERRATSNERPTSCASPLGTLVFVAAALSTLLALRDAPIGFDERQLGLERLAERAEGKPVAFLGVDRFAGYYLRETLARAPAGLRARGDRRPPGEDLAAGPGRRLRHPRLRASSTSSTTRSPPPPPTTRPRRRTSSRWRAPATTCSGSAAATRPRSQACSRRRARGTGRRLPARRDLPLPARRAQAPGRRRS